MVSKREFIEMPGKGWFGIIIDQFSVVEKLDVSQRDCWIFSFCPNPDVINDRCFELPDCTFLHSRVVEKTNTR